VLLSGWNSYNQKIGLQVSTSKINGVVKVSRRDWSRDRNVGLGTELSRVLRPARHKIGRFGDVGLGRVVFTSL